MLVFLERLHYVLFQSREVYDSAVPGFTGRCTAPLLVDRVERRIVSNESSQIVSALNALSLPGCTGVELRPVGMEAAIDELCDKVYHQFRWVRSVFHKLLPDPR